MPSSEDGTVTRFACWDRIVQKTADGKIRAFQPQASDAFVVTGDERIAMEKLDPQGFFSARLDQ